MKKLVCTKCGATFDDENSRIKNGKCIYCGYNLVAARPKIFDGIRGPTFLIAILFYIYSLYMAYNNGIDLIIILLFLFLGWSISLAVLKYKYLLITKLFPLALFLMLILFFPSIIMAGLGLGYSSWFFIIINSNFFLIIFLLTTCLWTNKSKDKLLDNKIKEDIKQLHINSKDLNEIIIEINEFKDNKMYRGLFRNGFKKLAIYKSEMELGKNNLYTLLDEIYPFSTPLTGQFIDRANFDSMYFFLEKIYQVRNWKPLTRDDFYHLYFNRLDEAIIFALEDFSEVHAVPLLTEGIIQCICNMKWDKNNEKFFNKLYEIKYYTLDFENAQFTAFKIFERRFLLFLSACVAVNSRRGYLENMDFIKAYKIYFKLMKVDITQIKPVEIDTSELKHTCSEKSADDFFTERYRAHITGGGLLALIILTKYMLFYFDITLLAVLIPLVITFLISFNTSDEYVPGIFKGSFISAIGSIPSIYLGIDKFFGLLAIYIISGIIGSYLGIMFKKITEGTFRSSPKEIELKERIGRGYLICNKCGARHDLKPWQSPDDFDHCQCRGDFEYYR